MVQQAQRRALPLIAAAVIAVMCACGSNFVEVPVGDSKNGQSVQVHAGDVVKVTLNRTGWTFNPGADPSVLRQLGDQVETPDPIGTCLPDMDCGVTTAWYKAVSSGSATVSATRVNCGEARSCPGTEGIYQVTVVVTA